MGKRQVFIHLIVFIAALVLGLKITATKVSAADYRVYKLANAPNNVRIFMDQIESTDIASYLVQGSPAVHLQLPLTI